MTAMPGAREIHAGWYSAHPAASASANTAAINAAIAKAKESRNATVLLGPGTFEINGSLTLGGANQGISLIGTVEGSLSQGSAPGKTVLKWVGGAAPMIDVSGTFHTFHGFSLQNNGSATHGIKCTIGGRQWIDRLLFSCPVGASPFSVASIEIAGVNYDRVTRCEFEAGPAIRTSGAGATLLVSDFMMDSMVGSGAFIDVRGGLDLLTIRDGTVNYQPAMRTFIDMSSIGSSRVSVCRVESSEFDGNSTAAQLTIATLKNCDEFIFEANQVGAFGHASNTESPITATDSRVTLRNNASASLNKPLVRTLDDTSAVFVYEHKANVTNTKGMLDDNSRSGNLIPVAVPSGGGTITLHGEMASPMASVILEANVTSAGNYSMDIARPNDSSPGYMTKGQVFTLVIINSTGSDTGSSASFGSLFSLNSAAPSFPANTKRKAVTFYWDGTVAREINRS